MVSLYVLHHFKPFQMLGKILRGAGAMEGEVPFSITPVEEDYNSSTGDTDKKYPWSLVQVGPQGWVLLAKYQNYAYQLYNYPVSSNQVWVCGFPRSGTTMMQELAWIIHNDMDFEGAKTPINKRVDFIDSCFLRDTPLPTPDSQDKARNVIKTHLAFDILPPKLLETSKVIFVARNPKDSAVSFFHFKASTDKFDVYWKQFESEKTVFGPYWKYTLQGWEKRNDPNVLFIFYEDTQKDMRDTIVKVAKHLGKTLSDEQISQLEEHMNINSFKKNKAVNHEFLKTSGDIKCDFVRKGGVGGWREHFSDELNASADAWIEKNTSETDFAFPQD